MLKSFSLNETQLGGLKNGVSLFICLSGNII